MGDRWDERAKGKRERERTRSWRRRTRDGRDGRDGGSGAGKAEVLKEEGFRLRIFAFCERARRWCRKQ